MCTYICEYLPIYVKSPLPAFLQTFNRLVLRTTISRFLISFTLYSSLILIVIPLQHPLTFQLTSLFGTFGSLIGDVGYSRWVAGGEKQKS